MNRNPIQVDQRSLQQLNMNFDEFAWELNRVCKQALANLGQRIISQAQTNLRRGRNVATSLLINSGAVKERLDDNSILAGFPTKYAYYTEFGRRAGKWPPFNEILQWVKVRHMVKYHTREERKELGRTKMQDVMIERYKAAFLIQRSIGKKGTKPHPFLRPAFEKNKRLYEQVIRKGASKILNKDYTR